MSQPDSLEILVIEDDPDTRANLRDVLELDAYRVQTAGTAAEALAREDWDAFFAIILDRRLPDGTAEQLLPRLKRLAPDASVLIVTGYRDLEGALTCLREGAADYILKPVNPDALRASLARIAERRQLHRARERSEAAFRHLVEAVECMIVMLRPDGSICYFSPFAEELTGYAAAEVLGGDYPKRFMRAEDQARAVEQIRQVFAGEFLRGLESPVRTRDGGERWLLWNARRLNDFDGAPALLAVGQDITERRKALERAMQSERLAAIGQMMTGLAHESRNALQRSKAFLELLADEVADRPDALELVAGANRAQDYLHRLYEEVRGYAAPIVLEARPCDLAEIWRETWASLSVARECRAIVLREEVADADPRIQADPFAIGQVLRNILENAIAACADPGEIHIRLNDAKLDGQPAVRLVIRDNGPGLTKEQRQRIFEPFFTTKTKGTGLGMAICQRIVESHGGRISVGVPSEGGAEIIVELPRNGRPP